MKQNQNLIRLNQIAEWSLYVLLLMCFCFPAQYQAIKLPLLAISFINGCYMIYKSRGKCYKKKVLMWFLAFSAYNLAWSAMGLINGNPGAIAYFRVNVIWPCVLFVVIAALDERKCGNIAKMMLVILALQVASVTVLVGYAFQIWPNFLSSIFPASAVGIHPGYVQATGHFIGGMAFTAPFAMCYIAMSFQGRSKSIKITLVLLWACSVFAIVLTSRRMLLIEIVACVVVMLLLPAFAKDKEKRKAVFRNVLVMGIGTALTMLCCIVWTANVSTSFLTENHDEILMIYQKTHDPASGRIKYTENLVYDIWDLEESTVQEKDEDKEQIETSESTEIKKSDKIEPIEQMTEPTSRNESIGGFGERIRSMADELTGQSARGKIICGAIDGWIESPIVGVGFGADLPGYPSDKGNGIYEMEYVVRMYTTGVVGEIILIILMLSIPVLGIKGIHDFSSMQILTSAAIVGYIGAAIATISNPYIFSGFDFEWMMFLPLGFINELFCENSVRQKEG